MVVEDKSRSSLLEKHTHLSEDVWEKRLRDCLKLNLGTEQRFQNRIVA